MGNTTHRQIPYLIPESHIMPGQFRTERSPALTGAQRLVLAVLQEACHTLAVHVRPGTVRAHPLVVDVERWVAGAPAPLRFEFVCAALDIDPGYLRRVITAQVTALRQRQGDGPGGVGAFSLRPEEAAGTATTGPEGSSEDDHSIWALPRS
jgi:hypothetical protein